MQEYEEKIQEAQEALKQADTELLAAEAEVDVDKYNKAKNNIWSAKHAKELYLKQQAKLKQEQLVTKEEYNQLLTEITQIADASHEEQNERAVALISELREISEESIQTSNQANELMHLLQRKVYKEPEGKIPLGDGTTTWSSDKNYRYQETVHGFYNLTIKGTEFSKRAGEEPEQPRMRFLK
ncbi:hypothetical protein CBF29_07640 [Vagococcus elongatus]|uniref:Uncharacterized protein n=1 Tax=Vagococcus elongatus TaxID=180344 RepID=A0A430AU91_9ENTE|nr:hypothetical protein CBF29_07640 [Vagococcus elongatus]